MPGRLCQGVGVDGQSPAAFRVADARRAGMSRRSIDFARFDRPFTGLRAEVTEAVPHDEHGHSAEQLRRAMVLAAQQFTVHMNHHEFFSHATAAVLWGLPLPTLPLDRLDVSVRAPSRAPRGRGVRGHQLASQLVTVVVGPSGLRVTSPASTWAQSGALLRHPYDLIALTDALIRIPRVAGPFGRVLRPSLATVADLHAELRRGRRVGVAGLTDALERTRAGAASRPETWCRLTIVDGGLPEPVLDLDIYDDAGNFVGCVDLAYPEHMVAIEYEGDHHRLNARQWQRDFEKHDRLVEIGWRVIRVTRSMLFAEPDALVTRVATALAARR
jgi:hypothetical protein